MKHSAALEPITDKVGRWFLHNGQRCQLIQSMYLKDLDTWQIAWTDREGKVHRTQTRVKRGTAPQLTFIKE